MKASVYGKFSNKCLDESLMNNIEPDEVEDVDIEVDGRYDVHFDFVIDGLVSQKDHYFTDLSYRDIFERMVFVFKNIESSGVGLWWKFNWNNDKVAGFVQIKIDEYFDFDRFCNLFMKLFFAKNHINTIIYSNTNATFEDEYEYKLKTKFSEDIVVEYEFFADQFGTLLRIVNKNQLLDFIRMVFRDNISEDVVIKTFADAFMNWQKQDGKETVICFDKEGNNPFYFVNANGTMFTSQQFYKIYHFKNGFAKVKRKCSQSSSNEGYEYNFVDKNGKCISDKWFIEAWDFSSEGFAKVNRGYKYNYIDKKGNCISDEGFNWVDDLFEGGFGIVRTWGRNENLIYNYVDKNGKYISYKWYGEAWHFSEGFAVVKCNGKYNFINKYGNYISRDWFDYVNSFNEGVAWVEIGKKTNFIDKNGKYIFKDWLQESISVNNFRNGFACVYDSTKRKYNLIDKTGKYISGKWFDAIHTGFNKDGRAVVEINGEYNFIDKRGNIILKNGFRCRQISSFVGSFYDEGLLLVKVGREEYNFIDKNGEYLYKNGMFERCSEFHNGVSMCTKYGRNGYLTTSGEFICDGGDLFSIVRPLKDIFILRYGTGAMVDSNGELVSLI